jgi:hypothetical protein
MDTQTIDTQYSQLQDQSKQTAAEISTLAEKLRGAAQSGNQDAREWMLDLKEIALAIQAEQNQVAALLQALHGFVASHANYAAMNPPPQPIPVPAAPQQPWSAPPGQPYPQAPYPQQQQGLGSGGMFGNFLNSGFGKAVTMGAGFGVGDTLINDIFGGFGRRGC